jgi:hypothetical protein
VCFAQQATNLKTGWYKSYDDFTENDPKSTEIPVLTPFVRINKLDVKYSDTLYKIVAEKQPFAVYDGRNLYIQSEDSLYRKMDYVGKYPYVKITTKVHLEGRWIYVNKTPVWEDEHDEVQSHVAFINRKGKWDAIGFESIRELLKGNRDLIVDYDKEKWNNDIFMKYLVKMNERYPIK